MHDMTSVVSINVHISIEFCPPRCKSGEIQCSRAFDCNGKPTESDICIPEFSNSDKTCVNHCPAYCYPDENVCDGKIYEDGCKDADFCIKSYVGGPSGQLCPTFCPVYCLAEEKLCAGPLIDGCQQADFCVPITGNFIFMNFVMNYLNSLRIGPSALSCSRPVWLAMVW